MTGRSGKSVVGSVARQLVRTILPDSWVNRLTGLMPRYGLISQGPGAGLYLDSGPGNPAYRTGANELPVQAVMAKYIRPGNVIYDVGANVGFFSVIGARLVGPTGTVYAFEPVPENARYVRRNATRNGFANVRVLSKAVSDRTGRETLNVAHYAGGAALGVVAPPPDMKGTISVDVVSIDELCDAGDLKPPDLVKIDVEGAELHVLRGMQRTLLSHRPILIYEVDDGSEAEMQRKLASCAEFLRSLEYSVERIEDSYPNTDWLVAHYLALPVDHWMRRQSYSGTSPETGLRANDH